ncbi:MAG: efflux RND transporter periplasmic adaptor subunit [Nitrospiraceae bacterium]|nr:MAG: efflux RND transporter periplasmic adaptor subunit [Nitrospiraceae bacterium]
MSAREKIIRIVLPVLILICGVGLMIFLNAIRPEPRKEPAKDLGALVNTVTVQKEDRHIIVSATGTVQPSQEVNVIPQVNGVITYISPSMVAGGFAQKDDLLIEIEDTDYRIALEQAKGTRARSEYDLAIIESQARVARSEWDRLNRETQEEPNPLVVYEPQLKNARAALAAAEATIEQAELNLLRTKIRAPFNCRVRSEAIDLGQYVNSGMSVAVIAGTDTAEIVLPLSPDDLGWIRVPGWNTTGKGSPATIRQHRADKEHTWHGYVIRSLGEVDTRSRMMKVVVGVQDPYNRLTKEAGRAVLSAGAFVETEIKGYKLSGVFPLPRAAVRDNETVWIMDDENMLRMHPVTIVRSDRDTVLVSEGLTHGDRVVITSLAGAVDGMKLRTETGERAE